MRLFLDANVLFTAAHNREGKSAFIIQSSSGKHWTTVTCALAIEEAKRNLLVKLPRDLPALDRLLARIEAVATVSEGECPLPIPSKDRPILLSALRAGCSHLISGDLRHFGKFMNQGTRSAGILIQTPSEFLSRFLERPD